jgi:hypothetical protein
MMNYVRDLILNEHPGYLLGVTPPEQVARTYVPVVFPSEMRQVHAALFSGTVTPEDRGLRAFQLLKLTESTEFSVYLRGLDNIQLVDLQTSKYWQEPRSFSIPEIDSRLESGKVPVFQLGLLARKYLDTEVVATLLHVHGFHTNPVFRVGALLTLFVLLADYLYRNRSAGA